MRWIHSRMAGPRSADLPPGQLYQFPRGRENVLQNNLQATVKNLHNAHAVFSLLKCFTDAACSVHVSQFWFQLFLCFLPLCSCSMFTAEPFCGPSVLPVLVHSTQQDCQCARAPWVFPKLWTSHHFQWSEWDLLIGTLRVCALPHLPVPEQLFSDGAAMAPLCHCVTLPLQNL